MPLGVTVDLIEVLGDGSVKVSGVFTGTSGFEVRIAPLTTDKFAILAAPNWSVVFSGAEITGDLIQFRSDHCGGRAKYFIKRYIGVSDHPQQKEGDAPVQCPARPSVECPLVVTGTATVGFDCDPNGNRLVTFALTFTPPIPQDAVAQVTWSFGGPNALGEVSATDILPTASGPVADHSHPTLMPPRPPFASPPNASCSYSALATITVIVNGQLCSIRPVKFCLIVNSCLPCPGDPARNRPPATLTITTPNAWCAPPQPGQAATFEVIVNFPAGTPGPPVPSAFDWVVTPPTPGGVSFLRETTEGSTTTAITPATASTPASGWRLNGGGPPIAVDLSQPGDYAVSVAVKFPPGAGLPTDAEGTPICNVTAGDGFRLEPCSRSETCPSVTAINVTPSCADPAAGIAANFSFAVSATDPSGLINDFTWDFGDPDSGSANQAVTSTPNANHSYSEDGNFTVTVTANTREACSGGGPATISKLVPVPRCPLQVAIEESFGCLILRELVAVLAALALLAILLAFCLSPLAGPAAELVFWVLIGIGIGFAVVAAGLLFLWLLFPCPRPCAWPFLMLGQIFFGVGWGGLYFLFSCCFWLGLIGIGALVIGIVLLALWFNECRPSFCRVMGELCWVVGAVVLPIVTIILAFPPVVACINTVLPPAGTVVVWVLSVAGAIIVATAATCAIANSE